MEYTEQQKQPIYNSTLTTNVPFFSSYFIIKLNAFSVQISYFFHPFSVPFSELIMKYDPMRRSSACELWMHLKQDIDIYIRRWYERFTINSKGIVLKKRRTQSTWNAQTHWTLCSWVHFNAKQISRIENRR